MSLINTVTTHDNTPDHSPDLRTRVMEAFVAHGVAKDEVTSFAHTKAFFRRSRLPIAEALD